jgi:hypothetical protein
MHNENEKRKKLAISEREQELLRWLLVKGFIHVAITILLSLMVLFFGLKFIMSSISFGNYGLSPDTATHNVQRFIGTYLWIAAINIVLIVYLSVSLLYTLQKRFIQPITRITKDLEERFEKRSFKRIDVRKEDTLIYPLVELINKLIAKTWGS